MGVDKAASQPPVRPGTTEGAAPPRPTTEANAVARPATPQPSSVDAFGSGPSTRPAPSPAKPLDIGALKAAALNGTSQSIDTLQLLAQGTPPAQGAVDALAELAQSQSPASLPASRALLAVSQALTLQGRDGGAKLKAALPGATDAVLQSPGKTPEPLVLEAAHQLSRDVASGNPAAIARAVKALQGDLLTGPARGVLLEGLTHAAQGPSAPAACQGLQDLVTFYAKSTSPAAPARGQAAMAALGAAAGGKVPDEPGLWLRRDIGSQFLPAQTTLAALARRADLPAAVRGDAMHRMVDTIKDITNGDVRWTPALQTLGDAIADPKLDSESPTGGGAAQAARELGRLKQNAPFFLGSSLGPRTPADELRDKLIAALDPKRGDVVNQETLAGISELLPHLNGGDDASRMLQDAVVKKVADFGPKLSGAALASVSQVLSPWANKDGEQALVDILTKAPNSPLGRSAAKQLSEYPEIFDRLASPVQDRVIKSLARAGDTAACERLLQQHPAWNEGPLNDNTLSALGNEFATEVSNQVRSAKPDSVLGKYGRLIEAHNLAEQTNSPDPKVRALAGRIRKDAVEADLKAIQESPEFKQTIGKIQEDVKARAAPNLAQDQAAYLMDDQRFGRKLNATPDPAKRMALMQKELSLLRAINPAQAEVVRQHWMDQAAQADLPALVGQLGDRQTQFAASFMAQAQKALGGTDDPALKDVLNDGKQGAKVSKNIVKALAELEKNGHFDPQQLVAKVAQMEREAELAGNVEKAADANKTIKFLVAMDKHGQLSSVATSAAVLALGYDLATKGLPKSDDYEGWAKLAKDSASITSNADNVSKLFVKGGLAKQATHLGEVAHALKWLGPAADATGAVLDSVHTYEAYQAGDRGRTTGYGMQAAGGAASAFAGMAILAGATGPGAPVVLIGGTLLIAGGMAVNYFFGDSEQEQFLKQLGTQIKGDTHRYYSY